MQRTVQGNRENGKSVKKRVQAGWRGRRTVAAREGKVHKMAVRPVFLYSLETTALPQRQEAELEVTDTKMLRFSLEMKRIKNKCLRGTARFGSHGDKVSKARLRLDLDGLDT